MTPVAFALRVPLFLCPGRRTISPPLQYCTISSPAGDRWRLRQEANRFCSVRALTNHFFPPELPFIPPAPNRRRDHPRTRETSAAFLHLCLNIFLSLLPNRSDPTPLHDVPSVALGFARGSGVGKRTKENKKRSVWRRQSQRLKRS